MVYLTNNYGMEEALELLVGPYEIRTITIDNFTKGKDIEIRIDLEGNQFGMKTIVFEGVNSINCNPEFYRVSDAAISSKDISEKNWPGVKYRVDIMQDAFSFYCRNIEIK